MDTKVYINNLFVKLLQHPGKAGIPLLVHGIDYTTKAGDLNSAAILYYTLGNLLDDLGAHADALKNAKKAYAINKSIEADYSLIAENLNLIGVIYKNMKNYTQAELFCKQAYDLAKKINKREIIAYSLGELGMIEKAKKNYVSALDYFESAILLFKEIGDIGYIQMAQDQIILIRKIMKENGITKKKEKCFWGLFSWFMSNKAIF